MGFSLLPSSADRVDVVCPSDPSIREHNDEAALVRYMETGDLSALNVPPDATIATLGPLSSPALSAVMRAAGVLPSEAAEARKRIDAGEDPAAVFAALPGAAEGIGEWTDRYHLAMVAHALKALSDLPGVVAVKRGSVEVYPTEHLTRIPPVYLAELAAHGSRISRLGAQGKASSASRSGAEPKAPARSTARRAKRKGGAS